jgi:hypothetical protein
MKINHINKFIRVRPTLPLYDLRVFTLHDINQSNWTMYTLLTKSNMERFFTYNLLFASLPHIQLMCFYFSNQKIWWHILFPHFNCLDNFFFFWQDKFCSSLFFNVFCFKFLFFYNFFAPYLVFLKLGSEK